FISGLVRPGRCPDQIASLFDDSKGSPAQVLRKNRPRFIHWDRCGDNHFFALYGFELVENENAVAGFWIDDRAHPRLIDFVLRAVLFKLLREINDRCCALGIEFGTIDFSRSDTIDASEFRSKALKLFFAVANAAQL